MPECGASVQSAETADATTNEDLHPLQKGEIPLTVTYGVPLKSSGTTEMAVINWPVFCENEGRLDELLDHLRNPAAEKLSRYYQSTRSFARKMLREFRP